MRPSPPVDRRSFADLVAETRAAMVGHLGLAVPEGADASQVSVPGEGLVRIFARLAEVVVDRLNQVPEKNLLAFLDLVGLTLQPPLPARVPLTFTLAGGSTGPARVPARTLAAAAPSPGEADGPVFETERELVVTATGLVAVWTREPARDRHRDSTAVATGGVSNGVPVFEGDRPVDHELYLADPLFGLDSPKEITVGVQPVDTVLPWLAAVAWERWDGTGWRPLPASIAERRPEGRRTWQVTLPGVPAVPEGAVAGQRGHWLRARLGTSLPPAEPPSPDALGQSGLDADAAFVDEERPARRPPLYPFGDRTPRTQLLLACERAFSKPGAEVTIDVELDPARAPAPSSDLALAWEYWDGAAWAALGRSAPGADPAPAPPHGFGDGTQAFTGTGAVRFRAPAGWAPSTQNGVPGYWLRASIDAGDFGPPESWHPPVLASLTLGYRWPLPRVDAIRASVHISRAALAPDLAFTNDAPVDLSKDFLPFGATPRLNDAFYLASDEALSKPGAAVVLSVVTGEVPPARVLPGLSWEARNPATGRWEALAVDDGTRALTRSGTVRFRAPAQLGPADVNGELRHWLRARIVKGDYGREATYEPKDPADTSQGFKVVPATLSPPLVASLTLAYDYTSPPAPPERTLTRNDFVVDEPEGAFLPYTPPADTRPTLYLGFDGSFAGRPTALFFGVPAAPYRADGDGAAADDDPATVAWDFWDGSGWAPLGTHDETRGFTRPGLVSFVAPADFAPSTQFEREAWWLRSRWARGSYVALPRLERVLTNTTWAAHAATVEGETVGSSTGEPGQVFTLTKAPVLAGPGVEVREAETPSGDEQALIEAEEGGDAVMVEAGGGEGAAETWVRWHQVVDFHGSGPRSRHYVLDHLTGELRFGDGLRGMVPPLGRANLRARYRWGGGAGGNRPPGTVTQLMSAVPYVDAVTNHHPAAGGSDHESVAAARTRGPRLLRHGGRAVAVADFEDLAFEASPAVARVKGIPAGGPASGGSVGLIVVPGSAEPQPVPSLELLSQVKDHVEARLSPTVDLWVGGPGWLRVSVRAEIVPVSVEAATDVEAQVRARLSSFLHPLTGGTGGTGWPFGRAPHRSDLLAVVEAVPGVDHVRTLTLDAELTEPGPVPEGVLVYSADHAITMVGGSRGGIGGTT